jgi:poly-gamma-glutamate synthesis protein (capsule biosynthesis protein)
MTGRGVDQVLPHPGDPRLHEAYVRTARRYVELAEAANGRIPRPVDFAYVWGDALEALAARRPDARIVNLETSVTRHDTPWKGKGIHYRMHPDNAGCLAAARIDCCVLANNHVLDYGCDGLLETLETLQRTGVRIAGAGRNLAEARAPATIPVPGKGRVLVVGFGTETSGIMRSWAATVDRPGVDLLPDLSDATLARIGERVGKLKGPGDIVIASIHWGSNWGFAVPDSHVRFAHGLVTAGVDVVHGHSSHHVRPIEVFDGRLILYGCGELLDDYEGIGGYEAFRADLAPLFFVSVDPLTGRLRELHLVPMQIRNFRLARASRSDAEWLRDTINRTSRTFGVRVLRLDDGELVLQL